MKRCLNVIGIVLLLLLYHFASCNSKTQVPEPEVAEQSRNVEGPSHELSAIDSMMWKQPDSALSMLQEFVVSPEAEALDTFDGHYCQVLISELLYKNDYEQTNRKELLQAVAYFDSIMQVPEPVEGPSFERNAFLTARAHYINGVGYYENDSAVEACKEYMKALEIMEDHFKEKDLVGDKAKFMAFTYTRLTDVYSDLYLHKQAIFFAQLSMPYYQKQNNDSWQISRMLYEIGSNYDLLNQLDTADYYYLNAIKILDDTNSLVFRDIMVLRSLLFYKKDRQQEITLSQLFQLLNQSNSEGEYLSRCLTIGEVYYYEKQLDSASYYLKTVYCNSKSAASRKQAAEWLVEICKSQGKESDILEYADFLVPFANQEENNSAIKSQLTELYNIFRQGVSERQHQRIVRKNAQWTAVAICGLLFIIFSIAWLYHKNKKKLHYIESQKPEEPAKAQNRLLAFMEEPICQAIVQSVQGQNIKRLATPKAFPELVLTDAQLQQLSMAAKRHFTPIEILLEQHGLKAKPVLVNLCQIYLLGMDEKQAAILLDRDYSSVKRYEKTPKKGFPYPTKHGGIFEKHSFKIVRIKSLDIATFCNHLFCFQPIFSIYFCSVKI